MSSVGAQRQRNVSQKCSDAWNDKENLCSGPREWITRCALKMWHFTQMDLQETLACESNSGRLISGQDNWLWSSLNFKNMTQKAGAKKCVWKVSEKIFWWFFSFIYWPRKNPNLFTTAHSVFVCVFPRCVEAGPGCYCIRVFRLTLAALLCSVGFGFTLQQPQSDLISEIVLCSLNKLIKKLFSCCV